jgi:hypothetical protein
MFKALDLWLPAWLRRERSPQHPLGSRHVLLCLCDHFEPFHGVTKAEALARMATWEREWPRLASEFTDCGGAKPKHTFFYPVEQYDSEVVGVLAELCAATGSETEVHLHHDRDTAVHLREVLLRARDTLAGHGLLSRDDAGVLRYGFVHGNWALDDSHPTGRHCGVRGELAILRQTGCFGDFTLPSAPNRTQTRTINSLYYARSTPEPKSHDTGRAVRADRNGPPPGHDELLIVQGPLALNWERRKFGVLPRIENGDLTQINPPTLERFRLWMECRIAVGNRPNWIFVKLHTHGAKPENTDMLLGEPMRAFHRSLAQLAACDPTISYHYVTARELVNILHAAEAGHSGDPTPFRDFRYRRLDANLARA